MLSTKEENETAVLNHLKLLPANNAQVEAYTLSSISESLGIDSSKVDVAISDLVSDDLVISRKVQINVYVPKNQAGYRVLSRFASKEYIGYSPYWSMSFAFALLFVLILAFGNFSAPSTVTTLNESYSYGVKVGVPLSFIVCLFGGLFFQYTLTKFRRWQLISEKSYRLLSDLIKHSVYTFVPLFVGAFLVLYLFGMSLQPTVAVGLLAISITFSLGYEGLKRRKPEEKKEEPKT